MTEEIATAPRRGPKPNPFTRLEKARAKAEKARLAYAKVQNIADALAEAEAEEQAALQELAEATAAAGIAVGFEDGVETR